MAFILAASDDGEPTEISLLQNESEVLARICLGHDDETNATYSVLVAMVRVLGIDEHREIHFDVLEAYEEDGQPLENWCRDGMETRRFLVGKHRKFALKSICLAVECMTRILRPEMIIMNTLGHHLPAKALLKYDAITQSVLKFGYRGGRVDPFNGSHMWILEREPQGTK